jgi:hypothetical protein
MMIPGDAVMTEDDPAGLFSGGDAPAAANAADELLARAEAGDWHAATFLGYVLAGRQPIPSGWSEHAVLSLNRERSSLRRRPDQDFKRLAGAFAEQGNLDRLRTLAKSHNWHAGSQLDRLLAERQDEEGLRTRAEAGSLGATMSLADMLAERGDLDGLRALADDNRYYRGYPALLLARLLAERGEIRELRKRAYRPDPATARVLADLLSSRGDDYRAIQVLETNDPVYQDNEGLGNAAHLRSGQPYGLAELLTWIIVWWLPAGAAVGVPAGLLKGTGLGIAVAMTLGLVLTVPLMAGFAAVTGQMLPGRFVTWLVKWVFRPVAWLARTSFQRAHKDRQGRGASAG